MRLSYHIPLWEDEAKYNVSQVAKTGMGDTYLKVWLMRSAGSMYDALKALKSTTAGICNKQTCRA